MTITLQRLIETRDGTFGKLTIPGNPEYFYTVERRSDGAHPRIPAGSYEMLLDTYHKGNYKAYQIVVPGRDRIMIHVANKAEELLGCIAPGRSLGFVDDQLAVVRSRDAYTDMMISLRGVERDWIVIYDPLK